MAKKENKSKKKRQAKGAKGQKCNIPNVYFA
jgi:hypothetical protein